MRTKFVLCDTCNGFSACLPCWKSQGNARGWSVNFLEAQKEWLLLVDRDRQIKHWPLLHKHLFTMTHANSEADIPDFSIWTREQFEQEEEEEGENEEDNKRTETASSAQARC